MARRVHLGAGRGGGDIDGDRARAARGDGAARELTDVLPAAGAKVGDPHPLVVAFGVAATCRPAGNVSMKATPVSVAGVADARTDGEVVRPDGDVVAVQPDDVPGDWADGNAVSPANSSPRRGSPGSGRARPSGCGPPRRPGVIQRPPIPHSGQMHCEEQPAQRKA